MKTVHITDSNARPSAPRSDYVYIEYSDTMDLEKIIKAAIRMSPDRIVVDLSIDNTIKAIFTEV